jgi:hypothetical protein
VRSKWIVSSIAACAVVGTTGVAYAAVTAVTSSTADVVVTTNSVKGMTDAVGRVVPFLSMTLPAGAWVLSANATLVNPGSTTSVRCAVYRGNIEIAHAATVVGSQAAVLDPAANLSVAVAVQLTGNTVISLSCSLNNRISGAAPRVDSAASLVAHKSSSLVQIKQ